MENDDKILELQEKLKKAREENQSQPRVTFITNCQIDFDGKKVNLRVLSEEQCVSILASILTRKNSFDEAAKRLGSKLQFKIGDEFTLEQIEQDIKSRIKSLNRDDKLNQIRVMQVEIDKLKSDKLKTKETLDKFEKLLKGD